MNIESLSPKQLTELKRRLGKQYFCVKTRETIPLQFDLCQVEAEIKRRKTLRIRTVAK